MICRLWHGWTKATNADAYEAYLRDELYPRLDRELADHGYRGHHVLRRAVGDVVEFVTMTWFDSLASVRGFAGDDYETPVISDTAARLLDHYDPKAAHFDLAAHGQGMMRIVRASATRQPISIAATGSPARSVIPEYSDTSAGEEQTTKPSCRPRNRQPGGNRAATDSSPTITALARRVALRIAPRRRSRTRP